jgi:DNA-binding Lrp family transcriptional regulator
MELTALQHHLIEKLRDGLPICSHPYRALADSLGTSEADILNALDQLMQNGLINRFGAILRHRPLGYRANAMCVFDIPDQDARDIGKRMAALSYVTLCYQRNRVPGIWPFNLYCMIHGREKMTVRAQIRHMVAQLSLTDVPQKVLFSKRCFAQHAGKYGTSPTNSIIPTGEQHEPA